MFRTPVETNQIVIVNLDVRSPKELSSLNVYSFQYETYSYCDSIDLAIPSLDLNLTYI